MSSPPTPFFVDLAGLPSKVQSLSSVLDRGPEQTAQEFGHMV